MISMSQAIYKVLTAAACCLSVISSAEAAACFSPAEAEAEAALSFEAELRVTGLSCRSAAGESLYPAYQKVMVNNADLFKTYQDTLLAYYKAHSKGDPAGRLHARETEVENNLALSVARQGLPDYCKTHTTELEAAVLDSNAGMQRRIAAYEAVHPSSTRICAS